MKETFRSDGYLIQGCPLYHPARFGMRAVLARLAPNDAMPNPIAPIPGRRTVLLSSVVFCLASALLLLQFVGLTLHACSLDIVNGLGAASCLCWLSAMSIPRPMWPRRAEARGSNLTPKVASASWTQAQPPCFPPRFVGFALFIEWLVFHSFAAYGPSRRALVGATLKLIASVLFCVQPFSGTLSR